MHSSRKVFLLDNEPRCIKAVYDPEAPTATVKEFKTFDTSIDVDDYVVVPTTTRQGFTVVRVSEVNLEPNLETDKEITWVVCKFDPEIYTDMLAKEAEFLNAAAKAERQRKKAQLKADMMADVDTSIKLIEG